MSSPPTPRTVLAGNLKRVREAAKLTQKDVEREVGIQQNTLSKYENGTQPPLDTILTLAALYRCDLDEIVIGVSAAYDSCVSDQIRHTRDKNSPAGTPRTKAGEDAPARNSTRELQRQIANLKTGNEALGRILGEVSVRVAGLAQLLSTYDRRPPEAGSSGGASSRVRRRR